MTRKIGLLVMAAICLLGQTVSAGKLREFAEEATDTPPTDAQPKAATEKKPTASAASSAFGTGTYPTASGGESFMGTFWNWLVLSPFEYRHRDPAAAMYAGEDGEARENGPRLFPEHLLGEPTVPYARADYNWQTVDGDIDADDVRVELGYKLLAFHYRTTMFADSSDGFELDINQYYGVFRYGGYRPDFIPGTFEVGLGLGGSQIKTNDSGIPDKSGGAMTFPLKYYPVEWLGFEFRPAWYTWVKGRRVGDYDISASVGWRFIQLRGGYRWMTLKGNTFNEGPYAGISTSF